MKKLKTTFKGLLLAAALLLGGANFAWADYSPIYQRTTESGENQWSASDIGEGKWVSSGDTKSAASCSASGLTVTESGYSRDLTKTIAPTTNAMLKLEAQWIPYSTSGSGSYNNYTYFKFGDNFILKAYPRGKTLSLNINGSNVITGMKPENGEVLTINLTVNTNSHEITAFTLVGTETTEEVLNINKSLTDISESYRTFLSTTTYTSLVLGVSKTAAATNATTTLKSITVSEEEQVISKYGYIVNYKEGETVVKTVSAEGYLNSLIPVVSVSNAFYGDDMTSSSGSDYSSQKYFVIADVAPVRQITATPAENVLDIAVRKQYTNTLNVYRVKDGVKEATPFITEALVESDSKVASYEYSYDYCYQVGTTYYIAPPVDGSFKKTVNFTDTPLSDQEVEYTSDPRVVKYVKNGSPSGKWDNVDITGTFTAGTYEIYWRSARQAIIKDGETELGTTSGSSNNNYLEFTLASTTSSLKASKSGNQVMFDFYVIRKTEEPISTCDNLGYTFSSTLPLDFSEASVRAYIATYDSEKDVVKLTRKTKIPANTGLLIFSDSELTNQSIPTTVETTDNVDGNKLIAVSADMTLEAATGVNENYVLVIEGGKPVFQKIGATSASMSAGQAYLQIPARTGSGGSARTIRVVFDDEDQTTGIKNLTPTLSESEGVVYNLQGRRITQPTKGLYIVNGKKVVIK